MSGRRLIYLLLFPIPWVVIGVVCLARQAIAGPANDAFGLYFVLVFGTICMWTAPHVICLRRTPIRTSMPRAGAVHPHQERERG